MDLENACLNPQCSKVLVSGCMQGLILAEVQPESKRHFLFPAFSKEGVLLASPILCWGLQGAFLVSPMVGIGSGPLVWTAGKFFGLLNACMPNSKLPGSQQRLEMATPDPQIVRISF